MGDVELARRRLNIYEFIDYVSVLDCEPETVFHEIVALEDDS